MPDLVCSCARVAHFSGFCSLRNLIDSFFPLVYNLSKDTISQVLNLSVIVFSYGLISKV